MLVAARRRPAAAAAAAAAALDQPRHRRPARAGAGHGPVPTPTCCSARRARRPSRCSAGASGGASLFVGVLEARVTLGVFVWALGHRARGRGAQPRVLDARPASCSAPSPRAAHPSSGRSARSPTCGCSRVVAVSIAAQLALHHVSATQQLFHLAPLSLGDWAIAFGAGFIPVSVLELLKLVRRRVPAPA